VASVSDTTPYNPASTLHRQALAQRLLLLIAEAGFAEEYVASTAKERVFYRAIDEVPYARVIVYSTIEGVQEHAQVRLSGKDAIRVCALYRHPKSKTDSPLFSSAPVLRIGTMEAICERTLDRMRKAYECAGNAIPCPKCKAPTFTSKKGNMVCVARCFEAS